MQAGDGEEGSTALNRASKFRRGCPTEGCRRARCAELKDVDIEMLACLAARLSEQDPDRRTTIKIGDVVAFDDVAWRYPDFLARAEAAYRILAADNHPG